MINNLVERVDSSLRNPGDSLWLPELTTKLVEAGWRDLYHTTGLLPDAYGTARVIARDSSAPCRIIARLPMFSGAESLIGELEVEIFDPELTRHYEQAGVKFYTAQDLNTLNVLAQLREALDVLKNIPSLSTTVAALVRIIHVLDPVDDEYDVSFSEPHIPFSVFVSVPKKLSRINVIRVAEAVIHEAMHLQLTLIERNIPLVKPTSQSYYSPWRGEFRNARGVLHGLYVFSVISQFLRELQEPNSSEFEVVGYVNKRLSEIRNQVNCIRSFQESKDLNKIGAEFTRQIIAEFNSN